MIAFSDEVAIPVIETGEVLVTATPLREKGSSFVTIVPEEELIDDSLSSVLAKTEGASASNYGNPSGL